MLQEVTTGTKVGCWVGGWMDDLFFTDSLTTDSQLTMFWRQKGVSFTESEMLLKYIKIEQLVANNQRLLRNKYFHHLEGKMISKTLQYIYRPEYKRMNSSSLQISTPSS
jgi:hypothetical protein